MTSRNETDNYQSCYNLKITRLAIHHAYGILTELYGPTTSVNKILMMSSLHKCNKDIMIKIRILLTIDCLIALRIPQIVYITMKVKTVQKKKC